MTYPDTSAFTPLLERFSLWVQLQHEYGAQGVDDVVAQTESAINKAIDKLARLPVDTAMQRKEPDDLPSIKHLRPAGPRQIWRKFDRDVYRENSRVHCLRDVPVAHSAPRWRDGR